LFGLTQEESIRYILEGAAARSDTVSKIRMIDAALVQARVAAGEITEEPELTQRHARSLSPDKKLMREKSINDSLSLAVQRVSEETGSMSLLKAQIHYLKLAKIVAEQHRKLVGCAWCIMSE
jgi:hypothetical protein